MMIIVNVVTELLPDFSICPGIFASPSCTESIEILVLHFTLTQVCVCVCSNLMFRFLHAVWKADPTTAHQLLLLLSFIGAIQWKIAASYILIRLCKAAVLLLRPSEGRVGYNCTFDHCGNKPSSPSPLGMGELCGKKLPYCPFFPFTGLKVVCFYCSLELNL